MNNHDSVYCLSLAWILLCFSLFLIICCTHITYHLYDIIYHALLTQYNHQPANEPHGSMNQNYTGDQLALFIASNCHNYVAWDVLSLPASAKLAHCRQDNNLPHDSSVEPSSRARMHSHNHLQSCLYFTVQNPEIKLRGPNTDFQKYPKCRCNYLIKYC